MWIFFVDDSLQNKPARPKMGQMLAVGGFAIEAGAVIDTESAIDAVCDEYGFPKTEPFKWSPGSELWMRKNLVTDKRQAFQLAVVEALDKAECKAVFIAEDKGCQFANATSTSYEIDVTTLLIERCEWFFKKRSSHGMLITDRQAGDYKKQEDFLSTCIDRAKLGTEYLKPANIIMPILSCSSRLSRLLQAADLVVGSTLSYVTGETTYSPPIIEAIKPLFIKEAGRIGGVGVKLHPWLKYGNFYHWLFGDVDYWHGNTGEPFPIERIAFSRSISEY
jgi:hypothetical protein